VSASLMILLSLGYLFVPREKLGDRSPLSVLAAPNKRELFECVGPKPIAGTFRLSELSELFTKTGCLKYSGTWQKRKTVTGSVAKGGLGWSDVGNLISKDLPAIGGLVLLIGASPAIAFFVYQSLVAGRASATVTSSRTADSTATAPPPRPQVPSQPNAEIGDRLQKLQVLHQQGLITDAELETRRQRLLDEI
jgi:hypothetical protein